MGVGDKIAKKLYMRQHSNVFRKHQGRPQSKDQHAIDDVIEDPVVELAGMAKLVFRIVCRNKQRSLQKCRLLYSLVTSNYFHIECIYC